MHTTIEPETIELDLARYMAIFDRSPIAIEYYDADGRLEVANKACLEMFGVVHSGQIAKFSLFDDPNITDDMKARLKKGETVRRTYDFSFDLVKKYNLYETTREGTCTLDIMVAPLAIGDKPAGYVAQIQDVTEQYRTERSLEESEKKYRLIAETIHDVFWMATPGLDRMIYVSPAYEKLWGRTPESLYESPTSFVEAIHPEDRQHFLDESELHRSNLTPWVIPYRVIRPDGTEIWVEDRGFPVFDANGSAYLFTGTVSDITNRKQNEERVRSLLSEKEILLQEVHHRLKNNMVTIMSLLSLQSDTVKDPAALAMLEDTKSRIRSMAVLYEKLYRSMDFRAISAREYLPALVKEIIENFANRESVSVTTDIEDITLDARVLSAVGIIINELITNAMKYAFDGRERGMIYVSFLTDGDQAALVVEDNGTGMPEGAKHGFGMQLVEMLNEQLDGSLRRERGNGTRFIMEFKHR